MTVNLTKVKNRNVSKGHESKLKTASVKKSSSETRLNATGTNDVSKLEPGLEVALENKVGEVNKNTGKKVTEISSNDISLSKNHKSVGKLKADDKRESNGAHSGLNWENGNLWWYLAFGSLVAVSAATRLYKIEEPDHICWDETHFGKFGSWYINRTFFFDVHPPLGKMLIGLFGVLTGYDGSFPFLKPGDKFEEISYVGMRACCALMGSCLIPFAFIAVWEVSKSLLAATLAASFILFDNGVLTLSRYILLDPLLMFFIMASVMAMAKCRSYQDRAFSAAWWFWLALTGVFLACSISVKFVGLFIVVYVGLMTAWDLWTVLGDLSRPIMHTINHFVSRVICLIILPVILYIVFFYIHLRVLNKSGTGDGFFSSAFQSQLIGNSLHNASMPQVVAYGAVVTLKNHRTGGGYLHSHWHLYPEGIGARQQQVTTYTHKDDNNKWIIKPYDINLESSEEEVRLVSHGDMVRLEHIPTKRNLHSHKEPAPVTKRHFQVTGYGEEGVGDANDIWRVEIIGGREGAAIETITSQIRFVHLLNGCGLQSSNKQLPKWAYEQMEVTCSPNLRDKNNVWNVEDNYFPKLPNVSVAVYAPNFWQKFVESHAVMLQGNSGLKPKEGEVNSKPWQWPVNYRGQFFSGNPYRIYLLGNPLIWWGNLFFVAIFICVAAFHCAKRRRGYEHSEATKVIWDKMVTNGTWLLIGWCLHYAPFWVMGRVLYFHHYFPALLFNSMLSGVILDFLVKVLILKVPNNLSTTIYHWLVGGILSMIVYSFYLYSPLTYGMHGPFAHEPNSTLSALKLLESWEF